MPCTDGLQVDMSRRDGTIVLTLAGSLTGKHVATLRRASFESEQAAGAHCVLDMTDVDEIDGYGLATLVGMLSRRVSKKGKLVLFGLRPDLRSCFEATFCDTLFPLRHNLAAALEWVGETSSADGEP